ncbi:MAG TPA: dihydrodipicolinate reductase [Anaeromyxobacteraceae bacterium]|nr:dihydrodipicolinate reductase [Anaeromyxobacteraceae bacterium]
MAEAESYIPVVVQGLGAIGRAIARAALEKPELKIVGAVDPAYAGARLPDLVGPGAPDLEVLADPGKAYAQAAPGGVVLHATASLFEEVAPQLERAVDARLHVVSTCEELAWPWLRNEEHADRLDVRCEKKGVAVVGVGVNPGFVLDRLPAFLSLATGPVRHVRALRVVDAATRRERLQRRVGLGLDEDAFHEAWERGAVGHVGLAESAMLVAAGCGFEIDEFEDECDPVVADRDIEGRIPVRAGLVAGAAQVVRGFVDDVERVRLELVIAAGIENPRDEVELDASPPVSVLIKGGLAGDLATAWSVVNAAPALIELHGLLTVLNLPGGR